MAYISQLLRTHVRTRAKFHCEYCKRPERLVGQKFEVDHIKPESKGGKTESDNLELSCRMCNSYKSDAESGVDPETEETVSLFNPRIQQWSQHFMNGHNISCGQTLTS